MAPMFSATLLAVLCVSTLADDVGRGDDVTALARPIEFAEVPRKVSALPEFGSEQPRFGLFLFGLNGETRVWAALDEGNPGDGFYDVLYLDRDADGNLAEERPIAGVRRPQTESHSVDFQIGDFAVPGCEDVHRDFRLTYHDFRVSFKMKWKGEKITMGLYGPDSESYGAFATTLEDAPVFVPGYDRPFTFEHWYSGTLSRTSATEFKVFIGNRGSRTGAFCCVDDSFLPVGEYPVATLIYHDQTGKEHRHRVKLTERC